MINFAFSARLLPAMRIRTGGLWVSSPGIKNHAMVLSIRGTENSFVKAAGRETGRGGESRLGFFLICKLMVMAIRGRALELPLHRLGRLTRIALQSGGLKQSQLQQGYPHSSMRRDER